MDGPVEQGIGESKLFVPRRRDRRGALGAPLGAVSRTIRDGSEPSLMRSVFESTLCGTVPVQSIRLRDRRSRSTGARDLERDADAVVIDVPGRSTWAAGVLEARFEPGRRPGEWDLQVLGAAAQVGALILEVERARLQLARAAEVPVRRSQESTRPMVGSTPAIEALRSRIARVAATDFTVLIEGESGVGKELVAREIHEWSARRAGPFVAINCAALVETLLEAELFGIEERTATGVRGRRGKFEHADGGTLFLDEVSDLSASAQAKLLRAIQDLAVERVGGHFAHRVDIRLVAATNRSLRELVERGLFRTDLYYRLSGVDLRVPPLRECRADVLPLAHHFLEKHRPTRSLRLSQGAAEALLGHEWPGNVRELERLMEHLIAWTTGDVIEVADLPPAIRKDYAEILMPSVQRQDTMRAWGRRYARLMLARCRGNKRETSRVLGISYHTLAAYLRPPGSAEAGAGEAAADSTDDSPTPEECPVS